MDTDAALAAALARDVNAAFPALVAGHADRLYSIALRLLGDPRDAEEVAQDAFIRAHRALTGYEPARVVELRLRPWLAAICVNLARNRRRNLADRRPPIALEPLLAEGFDPLDPRAPQPEAVASRRAGDEELAELLLRLPTPLRAAVVLRHVEGLSVAETAEALGRPEGTIKAQVSRGLARLRILLGDGAGGRTGLPAPSGPSGAGRDTTSTTHRRDGSTGAGTLRSRAICFEVLP